ncbi:hypothetical protein L1987_78569 [Smallanthus sonchifolius]|uniref:Uncharacterized protein n=1 Tax=Smallanthus sonchifolius TaxID=185202 RepID=A0ACB8ZCV1_9ASTR|nr:hypothetical protein L1987_78569 [Smallanthus sonchifolius]
MTEKTGTSGCDHTEEIPVTEASISQRSVSRSREADVTPSGTGKRRRFGSQDEDDVFQLQYRFRRDVDVNFQENVVLTAVSGTSDHVNSSFMCSVNDDPISDLKAECLSEIEIFMSINDGVSRDTSTSSVICSETKEIESKSTASVAVAVDEATSRRKPPPAAKMPSAAELEEFFSKSEAYEQKPFAEKYNYDVVKDVPMEGRYQWVLLKP